MFSWLGAELATPGLEDGPAVAFVRADQLARADQGPAVRAVVRRITPRGALAAIHCEVEGAPGLIEVVAPRSEADVLSVHEVWFLKITGGQVFPAA